MYEKLGTYEPFIVFLRSLLQSSKVFLKIVYSSLGDDVLKKDDFLDITYKYNIKNNAFSFLEFSMNSSIENYLSLFSLANYALFPKNIKPIYYNGTAVFGSTYSEATFNEDTINLSYLGEAILFKRYYKNDWSVLFSRINSDNVWTLGLDFRHRTDKIAEILAEYKNRLSN